MPKKMMICEEDCFNCTYPDCIATPRKEYEQILQERKRLQERKIAAQKEKERQVAFNQACVNKLSAAFNYFSEKGKIENGNKVCALQ